MEETKMGIINGFAGQDGTSDIMQANVATTSGQTDWYTGKADLGLQKGESATPVQSLSSGIRILFIKGLITTEISA